MSERARPPVPPEAQTIRRFIESHGYEIAGEGEMRGAYPSDTAPALAALDVLLARLSEKQSSEAPAVAGASSEGVLRTGRKVGRTLYRQIGAEPSDDDPLVGVMDTRELAAEAAALSLLPAPQPEAPEPSPALVWAYNEWAYNECAEELARVVVERDALRAACRSALAELDRHTDADEELSLVASAARILGRVLAGEAAPRNEANLGGSTAASEGSAGGSDAA